MRDLVHIGFSSVMIVLLAAGIAVLAWRTRRDPWLVPSALLVGMLVVLALANAKSFISELCARGMQ
jgi:hypothetical protein